MIPHTLTVLDSGVGLGVASQEPQETRGFKNKFIQQNMADVISLWGLTGSFADRHKLQ